MPKELVKPGEGGINPETWTKESVSKLTRKFNQRHGLPSKGDHLRGKHRLTGPQRAQLKRSRKAAAKRARLEANALTPTIPKLSGPRIPVGSILEAVKRFADEWENPNPYQLAVDVARKISYKYTRLTQVVRIWDNISATQRKKKLSLDWIVEYCGMAREEFKALILTQLREEAIERAKDIQLLSMEDLTKASLQFASQPLAASSKERIKHLEKHGVLLPPPHQGGVVVNTNVTQQSAHLPSMEDWSKTITEDTESIEQTPEPRQLPEASMEGVIDAEVFTAEREGELATI